MAADMGEVKWVNANPETNLNVTYTSCEELSRRLLQYFTLPTQHPTLTQPEIQNSDTTQNSCNAECTPHVTVEKVVSLRDLSCFQHREFKKQGGQICDSTSNITYTSVC